MKMKSIAAIVATLVLAGGIGLAWQYNGNASADKPGAIFKPDDAKIVAAGKVIYDENCAACHGKNLEGQANWRTPNEDGRMPAPPHTEDGHTWHHHDQLLFGLVKFGAKKLLDLKDYETDMPIFNGVLTDQEIIAALSYIKSKWPANVRKRHDQMNAQYESSK